MRPPVLKHWIQNPNARPPHAPIKYFVAFQKKIAMPPPAMPATTHARTNSPRKLVLGGLTASRTPKRRMRHRHVSESV